jgi:hypothetical protein
LCHAKLHMSDCLSAARQGNSKPRNGAEVMTSPGQVQPLTNDSYRAVSTKALRSIGGPTLQLAVIDLQFRFHTNRGIRPMRH